MGVANSCNIEEDTCHSQSMCWQTPLRFHLTLREMFRESTCIKLMKNHDKSTLMEISQVFRTLWHVDWLSVFRNSPSYRVVWRSFSQSLISERDWLWSSSFFSKGLKFDVDSRNGIKNSENFFRFSDNCIWIGSCKFPKYWKGYLPSTLNVLTNTP